jgi:hypothetical protein
MFAIDNHGQDTGWVGVLLERKRLLCGVFKGFSSMQGAMLDPEIEDPLSKVG